MERATAPQAPIERLQASAYVIPTDLPEADGTIAWDSTTLVVAEVTAGGQTGMGYTYASAAAVTLIREKLTQVVAGQDAIGIPACWFAMVRAVCNVGRPGIASMAISAVDNALWDLKGHLLGRPVAALLGEARAYVPVYGSGGFTSYSIAQLQGQLACWVEEGISRVKMKIGTHPADDLGRVRAARDAIGPDAELFVDANGAYQRKQALAQAERFAELGVSWFEEPVPADDLEGLRLLRDRAPAGMEIAAGEYGFDVRYFRRMLEAGAVDVLQADATRCGGITGFLQAADVCLASGLQLSAHCAPALHVHPCCSALPVRHLEYFHDHVCIEQMLFDGTPAPRAGVLSPDWSRPGLGLEFKRADARRYAVPAGY
jgi:L-alanine-DL-glutamate epimerase-like enolase superfamily enzyme